MLTYRLGVPSPLKSPASPTLIPVFCPSPDPVIEQPQRRISRQLGQRDRLWRTSPCTPRRRSYRRPCTPARRRSQAPSADPGPRTRSRRSSQGSTPPRRNPRRPGTLDRPDTSLPGTPSTRSRCSQDSPGPPRRAHTSPRSRGPSSSLFCCLSLQLSGTAVVPELGSLVPLVGGPLLVFTAVVGSLVGPALAGLALGRPAGIGGLRGAGRRGARVGGGRRVAFVARRIEARGQRAIRN